MKEMTIVELARMIRKDWEQVSPRAEPYLVAMEQLVDIKDTYGTDKGRMIVAYFLCNAVNWRGDLAHNIKKELNRRIIETLK